MTALIVAASIVGYGIGIWFFGAVAVRIEHVYKIEKAKRGGDHYFDTSFGRAMVGVSWPFAFPLWLAIWTVAFLRLYLKPRLRKPQLKTLRAVDRYISTPRSVRKGYK